jgi:hypothetical protein
MLGIVVQRDKILCAYSHIRPPGKWLFCREVLVRKRLFKCFGKEDNKIRNLQGAASRLRYLCGITNNDDVCVVRLDSLTEGKP